MTIKPVYVVDGVNWSGGSRNREDRRAVTNMAWEESTLLDDK